MTDFKAPEFTNQQLREFDVERGDDARPNEDWVFSEAIDHTRWSVWTRVVVHEVASDTFWEGVYEDPATEYQEVDEDRKIRLNRVYPKVVTKTIYVKQEDLANERSQVL